MREILKMQANCIEMVLARNEITARVTGGVVTPRWVRFHLALGLGTRPQQIQALGDEIALALNVPYAQVWRRDLVVQVDVPRLNQPPISLVGLCRRLPALPYGTAILGIADDGAPLLLRLPSPSAAQVLIVGAAGSGKTALARTIVLGLALTHRPDQLKLILIDPQGCAFRSLAALPHLFRPAIIDAQEATEALGELIEIKETRRTRHICRPLIVVAISELADLVVGQPAIQSLLQLALDGCTVGVHLIASTREPAISALEPLMRSDFTVRLVGHVTSIAEAHAAAGVSASGAERLAGRGDFIAVSDSGITRFQAAFISADETIRAVERLQLNAERAADNLIPVVAV